MIEFTNGSQIATAAPTPEALALSIRCAERAANDRADACPWLSREDLVQDARLAVLEAQRTWDPARSAFGTWATRKIGYALAESHRRGARASRERPAYVEDWATMTLAPAADAKLLKDEATGNLWNAVGKLKRQNERVGRVIEAYFLEGMTLQQIADQMGLSDGRIHQLKEQGLAALREELEVWMVV